MLAIPMCLLYELGVVATRLLERQAPGSTAGNIRV
jgi:Sec-independent protein secretion pathway component TatC